MMACKAFGNFRVGKDIPPRNMSEREGCSSSGESYSDSCTYPNSLSMWRGSQRDGESEGLPVRDCHRRQIFAAMKFSTSFICKNAEERVKITSLIWKDANSVWSDISNDTANPSIWNPNGAIHDVNNFIDYWSQ